MEVVKQTRTNNNTDINTQIMAQHIIATNNMAFVALHTTTNSSDKGSHNPSLPNNNSNQHPASQKPTYNIAAETN